MSKKYYWLKLKNDFFAQPKIKKLRRLAGGDKQLQDILHSKSNAERIYFFCYKNKKS